MDYFSLKFKDDRLEFINQVKLPLIEEYISTDDFNRIAEAIEKLEIRGAPLIGIASAYALALSVKNSKENFYFAYDRLKQTRPTAVNLFYALERMRTFFEANVNNKNYDALLSEARKIHSEDIEKCERIAQNGVKLFDSPQSFLTHCNTGALAVGGEGTALGVIFELHRQKKVLNVWVDETRPLLQGLRLTSFELMKRNIPFKVVCDSTASYLMQKKLVDAVILGADRIAKNGDTANKIGTYSLAVNANYHKIPFYVCAPETTIDRKILTGNQITIEERDKSEIISINEIAISKSDIDTFNPAFDLTPANLITAIITDVKVYYPPFNF
ncbi:MAG: S-methyl-5-thioribose-1-phosphate isomerase [Ignavibacteria bacterium]|nr:S-methyl-5-thioribose-1-phosphate isomerase [Ignavibacteria bacterium]